MLPSVTPSKTQYTETEAAQRLGVTVEQLRQLVQRHLVSAEDGPATHVTIFSSSDLVMLRMLTQQLAQFPQA